MTEFEESNPSSFLFNSAQAVLFDDVRGQITLVVAFRANLSETCPLVHFLAETAKHTHVVLAVGF